MDSSVHQGKFYEQSVSSSYTYNDRSLRLCAEQRSAAPALFVGHSLTRPSSGPFWLSLLRVSQFWGPQTEPDIQTRSVRCKRRSIGALIGNKTWRIKMMWISILLSTACSKSEGVDQGNRYSYWRLKSATCAPKQGRYSFHSPYC